MYFNFSRLNGTIYFITAFKAVPYCLTWIQVFGDEIYYLALTRICKICNIFPSKIALNWYNKGLLQASIESWHPGQVHVAYSVRISCEVQWYLRPVFNLKHKSWINISNAFICHLLSNDFQTQFSTICMIKNSDNKINLI